MNETVSQNRLAAYVSHASQEVNMSEILRLACQVKVTRSILDGGEPHSNRQRCNGQPVAIRCSKNVRHRRITSGLLQFSPQMNCSFSSFSLGQGYNSCFGGPAWSSQRLRPYTVQGSSRNLNKSASSGSNFHFISSNSNSGCVAKASRNGAVPTKQKLAVFSLNCCMDGQTNTPSDGVYVRSGLQCLRCRSRV